MKKDEILQVVRQREYTIEQLTRENNELKRKQTILAAEIVNKDQRIRHLEHVASEAKMKALSMVSGEIAALKDRIDALLEANHESAKRISELEKEKVIEVHTEYEPNRYDLRDMCMEPWWLGNEVLTDEDETFRYPWIDYRDHSRFWRMLDFYDWIIERRPYLFQRESTQEQVKRDPLLADMIFMKLRKERMRKRDLQKQKKNHRTQRK